MYIPTLLSHFKDKSKFIPVLLLFFFFFVNQLNAQFDFDPDSMARAIKKMPDDSNKVKNMSRLCIYYLITGHYDEAEPHIMNLRKIAIKTGNKKAEGVSYNFMGAIYDDKGRYPEAIEAYLKAKKLFEVVGNKKGLSDLANNLGLVYFNVEEYEKALIQFKEAIKLVNETGMRQALHNPTHNMGQLYAACGKTDSAFYWYRKALKLREEFDNIEGRVSSYLSLGNLHQTKKNIDSAVYYHRKCLLTATEMGEPKQITYAESVLGKSLLAQKKYAAAEKLLKAAEKNAKETGLLEVSKNVYSDLSTLYEAQGKAAEALKAYKSHIVIRDSMLNEENIKKRTSLEMQFEFDRKEDLRKMEEQQKALRDQEEKEKQAIIRNAFILGFVLMSVAVFFILRGYQQKKKDNQIILEQKKEVEAQKAFADEQRKAVEEKQKEILDSIHYARRIQKALITNEKYIERVLKRFKRF